MTAILDQSLSRQFDKLPPNAIETEMCLLASMILSGGDLTLLSEIRSIVHRDQFYQADHQIIFDLICRRLDKGEAIDAMLLREDLIRADLLQEVGGVAYLMTIVGTVPSAAHGVEYAKVVREKFRLREAIRVANETIRMAYGPADDDSSAKIIDQAMTQLAKVSNENAGTNSHTLAEVLEETIQQIDAGGARMVSTGFRDVDALGGGIEEGEMCLIGARPSMGKSTLSKQIALRAARAGVAVGIVSLEEGRFKIGRNILASESGIQNSMIRRGTGSLGEFEWKQVMEAAGRLHSLPIHINDRIRKLSDIRAQAAHWRAKYGVRMLIVDYLQRVDAGGKDPYERASLSSTGISNMLKDVGMAGIVMAQLNRANTARDDKRPTMADLRDSGQIEQDADVILFLHREDYYHQNDPNYMPTHLAELLVAKWRDSMRGGTVWLASDMRYQRFDDHQQPQGQEEGQY